MMRKRGSYMFVYIREERSPPLLLLSETIRQSCLPLTHSEQPLKIGSQHAREVKNIHSFVWPLIVSSRVRTNYGFLPREGIIGWRPLFSAHLSSWKRDMKAEASFVFRLFSLSLVRRRINKGDIERGEREREKN